MPRRALLPTALALAAALAVACSSSAAGGGSPATGDEDVTIDAVEPFRFDPDAATAEAGEISIALVNDGRQRHSLVVEGHERDLRLVADGGASDAGTITLEPGTYTYYCDVAGHRSAGMEGTLEVG